MNGDALSAIGADSMIDQPERPPRIVGSTDGTWAVLKSDGSAASFVDEKWQPGIAFESQDFLDMSQISKPDVRAKILDEAADALAKSLEE